MQIMIKIAEEDYNRIKDIPDTFESLMSRILRSIKNGVVLSEEQKPKTGHWIKSNIRVAKVCSVCNAHMGLSNFKFCPNCGAEMSYTFYSQKV